MAEKDGASKQKVFNAQRSEVGEVAKSTGGRGGARGPRPASRRRPASLLTGCELVPTGNGNFRAVPRLPRDKVTITQAAQLANYSHDAIYRLYKSGFIVGEKQSPRRILIDVPSLQAHLQAVRDPAFWTTSRRAQLGSA